MSKSSRKTTVKRDFNKKKAEELSADVHQKSSIFITVQPGKDKTSQPTNGYEFSSDSPTALKAARKVNKEADIVRRQYKAKQLAAIASTFFPSSKADLKEKEAIQDARKKAYTEYKKSASTAPFDYPNEVKQLLQHWAERHKDNSLYHNAYFRRAFRRAVPVEKALEGGSANYSKYQGKIREELYNILVKDNEEMQWKETDFSTKEEWKAVQHMLQKSISNVSKQSTTGIAIEKGTNTDDTSPRMAFHHIVWKEACNGLFSKEALNIINLIALNDQRTSKDAPDRIPGGHQNAHDITGYEKEWGWVEEKFSVGGKFQAIDLNAVKEIWEIFSKKREYKADIYSKSQPNPKLGEGNVEALGKVVETLLVGKGKK